MSKYSFAFFSGGLELKVKTQDAIDCSHVGDCAQDVMWLSNEKYISDQREKINPNEIRSELNDYGCWDDDELADDDANWQRILWIACCDIRDQSEIEKTEV